MEAGEFNIKFQLRLLNWGRSARDKVLSVVVVIAIVGALGMLGYVLVTPKVGEKFTEFYILGEEGKATDYVRELKIEETGRVVVGIINREHRDIHYRVEVWSAGTTIGKQGPVMLQHGEKWEGIVSFIPNRVEDNQQVEFLLYRNGESEPYLKLRLLIDVEERK